jgi:hypothetical protein
MADDARTLILTGSPDTDAATAERVFTVLGEQYEDREEIWPVSEHDAALLMACLRTAARVPA